MTAALVFLNFHARPWQSVSTVLSLHFFLPVRSPFLLSLSFLSKGPAIPATAQASLQLPILPPQEYATPSDAFAFFP